MLGLRFFLSLFFCYIRRIVIDVQWLETLSADNFFCGLIVLNFLRCVFMTLINILILWNGCLSITNDRQGVFETLAWFWKVFWILEIFGIAWFWKFFEGFGCLGIDWTWKIGEWRLKRRRIHFTVFLMIKIVLARYNRLRAVFIESTEIICLV